MMVRITTNAPCDALDVSISVGATGEAAGEAATQQGCHDATSSPAYVGSIVLVPSDRDVPLTLRVMAGVGRSAQSCIDAFGKGCIVARRKLRYVAHSTLTLPVLLDTQCDGEACSESSTCVLGKCVDAALDPNACLSSAGCTPPTPDAGVVDSGPVVDGGSVRIAHIAAGGDSTCAVGTDGAVRCWGRNDVGQLGIQGSASCGSAPCERKPVLVATVPAATQVSVGPAHACAVATTGTVYCWGGSASGETSVIGSSVLPVKVPLVKGATAVGAGGRHSCATTAMAASTSHSNLYCWGDNGNGQLGRGAVSGADPTPVALLDKLIFSGVATGDDFTCAAVGDATAEIYCWGAGTSCQNGVDCVDHAAPTYTGLGVGGLAAGGQHACAHSVWVPLNAVCWGADGAGQVSGTPGAAKPIGPQLDMPAVGIGAGVHHSCAILDIGAVRCWGDNSKGQRGLGNNTPFNDTVLPAAAVELALGAAHTCALAKDGKVYCWGDGMLGQLGDGSISIRANPLPVQW